MTELYHENQTHKKCTFCKKEKAVTDFHKVGGKHPGYRATCKQCRSDLSKHPIITQKPLFIISKICTGCDKEKDLEKFDKAKGSKDGVQAHCKECRKEKNRQRRIDNRERFLEYDRKRMKSPERREQHRKRYEDLYSENPQYKEKRKVYRKKRYRDNPLEARQHVLKRLAIKKGATTEKVDLQKVLDTHGNWCYICEKPIYNEQRIAFDHVIPLQPRPGNPQGTHSEDNIRPTHHVCNIRKSNRRFEDLTPFLRRGVERIIPVNQE